MILWLLLASVYVVLCITTGVMTFKAKHYLLFAAGFLLPFLWVVGAVIQPRHAV